MLQTLPWEKKKASYNLSYLLNETRWVDQLYYSSIVLLFFDNVMVSLLLTEQNFEDLIEKFCFLGTEIAS